MPTNDERREVAARLRELPIDMTSEMDKWEEDGLFIEPSIDDEADYSQIHNVLFGCLPAELMHPCDYEELHARLADLIEPEERTCRMEPTRDGSVVCSACRTEYTSRWLHDGEYVERYCPNCGARVVDADA